MSETKQFEVGQTVRWTGRANGGKANHEGTVVAVIAPFSRPVEAQPEYAKKLKDGGDSWREHVSYLVSAEGRIWWPIVSGLKLVACAAPMPAEV